jgi:cation:H+ antiporter
MLALEIVLLLLSVPLLARASESFVAGASGISLRYKVSPVVIGAVVIGFGTSLPEALASVVAAFSGSLDVAVGNVIGSNVANLTLVLAPAALLTAVRFSPAVLRRELLAMLLSALLLVITLLDSRLTLLDAALLGVSMVLVLVFVLRGSSSAEDAELEREVKEFLDEDAGKYGVWARAVGGLVGTVAGAYLLVWSASALANRAGLSEGFVGVSIVAVGTSLPEILTALHAARRGEGELIVGNILGSNVFNALMVMSLASFAGPGNVSPDLATSSAWVMLGLSAVVGFVTYTVRRIPRFLAPLLFLAYPLLLAFTL